VGLHRADAWPVDIEELFMTKEIYKTFEQWMNGNFLEVKEPRKKAYSKDELLLVEMGWKYGYDAGRAVEQALDKKAENARELGLDYEPVTTLFGSLPVYDTPPVQEPVAWMGTDIEGNPNKFRLNPFNGGVELYKKPQSVKVWDAEGYDALMQELELWKAAAQRQWVGLTDEELRQVWYDDAPVEGGTYIDKLRQVEAKLKGKHMRDTIDMAREDITRMAREAGFVGFDGENGSLRRFAALVRADEREACAKEFDRRAVYVDGSPSSGWYEPDEPARIIRARGNT
jgi:hypothetical protein